MKRIVVLAVLALLLALLPQPGAAISYGEPDRGRHPNVGAVVAAVPDPETGQSALRPICTGTLVDEDVVVSAAHCFVLPFEVDAFYFSLAPVVDADGDGVVDPGVRLRAAEAVPHPRFGSGGANNPYDLAVLLLARPVTGVTPAPLPDVGLLADRSVRDATFVAVGYGIRRETRRKAHQSFLPGGRRMMAEQSFRSLTTAWLNLSMNQATGDGGTCYGDSGGPHFLGDVVVSVTVTGDAVCKALDATYRLDTRWALAFLSRYVSED